MKILHVMAGAPHGGAETAFVDMCIAMKEAGHIIAAVTRENTIRVTQLSEAGIPVRTLPYGGTIDIWTTMRLKSIIRDYKADIVQTWMARAAQKMPKHSIADYVCVSRLGGYYKLKNFRHTDHFTTITPDIRNYLVKEGVPTDRVTHINNFAETEKIGTPVKRSDFGTPENATVLLALGRLHTSKAFDTLIKAVAPLNDIHIWIAGEGPDRAELEDLIATENIQDRVKLLGWRSDRAALFQAADICIFPSRYEPFGTVFVQAWANKTPLITTNSAGPSQYVRDGEDGIVVQIDDINAMSAAIRRLADDKDLQEKIVKNGLKRYKSEFSKKEIVKQYLDFYERILSERAA